MEQLEGYAWCERGQKIVDPKGRVQINGRTAKISPRLSGQRLNLYETLDGLEAQAADGTCYLVRNYRPELCRPRWYGKTRRWVYTFERQVASLRIQDAIPLSHTHEAGRPVTSIGASPNCPRIAVAL